MTTTDDTRKALYDWDNPEFLKQDSYTEDDVAYAAWGWRQKHKETIRSALEKQLNGGWLPIETAPKEGMTQVKHDFAAAYDFIERVIERDELNNGHSRQVDAIRFALKFTEKMMQEPSDVLIAEVEDMTAATYADAKKAIQYVRDQAIKEIE
jgi:hypothetical protein